MLKFLGKKKKMAEKIDYLEKEAVKLTEVISYLIDTVKEHGEILKEAKKDLKSLNEFKEKSKKVINRKMNDQRTEKYTKWLHGEVGKSKTNDKNVGANNG